MVHGVRSNPQPSKTPVSCPKRDEYWVIIEGAGTVDVGSRSFQVDAGDCVAIGMGHHHDLPEV